MSKPSEDGENGIDHPARPYTFAFFTLGLLLGTLIPNAIAQTLPLAAAANAVTMAGSITDTRNLPIAGAVITARGSMVGWTASVHDGSFRLSIPAGSYEILVRKGGYTPSATSVVLSKGSVKTVSLVLAEANLSSVNINSVRSGTAVPFATGVSATATLTHAAISERPGLSVRDMALELPGITLAHPAKSVPDTSFVVRGGTDETRVQIDGHGVSAGATGRWNSSIASQGRVPLTRRLRLFAGEYYTDWKVNYGTIVTVTDFTVGTTSLTQTIGVRQYRHNDPHVGFGWRPQSDTAFRFTAGSAISVPSAQLVAGGTNASGAFTGAGIFAETNPNLQPESTVAYDLGFDHRFHDGTVLGVDVFDNDP